MTMGQVSKDIKGVDRRMNMFTSRIVGIIAMMLIVSMMKPLGSQPLAAKEPPLSISAEAASIIDVQSGRILWSHRGDEPMLIASTTKIMTAIVAIELGNLSDRVKVSTNAVGKEGSSIYLREGEEMSLHHLLYGLMLRSGNDAAVAIAEHIGGSEEGFAMLMNQKAEELGMTHSHFVNPHGLNAEGHYASANDLAKLTAYALKNPVFQEIVKTKVKKVPNPYEPWDRTWYNKNKMLSLYEGADGVKTGYTKLAGRALVSSATRGGRQIVAVTLNDGNDWIDHSRMLDYGFQQFELVQLIQAGSRIESHPELVAGASFHYALSEQEIDKVKMEVQLHPPKSVEYRLGERGKLVFQLSEPIGAVPLYEQGDLRLQNDQASLYVNESVRSSSYREIFKALLKELFVWSI